MPHWNLQRSRSWMRGCAMLALCWMWACCQDSIPAQTVSGETSQAPVEVRVLAVEGEEAWVFHAGSNDWQRLTAGAAMRAGDRGRTGPRTRMMLRLRNQGEINVPERSEFLIEQPAPDESFSTFSILRGMGYFFHRGEPEKLRFRSRTATAAVRGTEFLFAVEESGRTVVTLFDGEVALSSEKGTLLLTSGEAGQVDPGEAPNPARFVEVAAAMQWRLYYPVLLDAGELAWTAGTEEVLGESLAFYRLGDVQAALQAYPVGEREPEADEAVYLAGLLLSVGQVAEAEALLEGAVGTERARRLGRALQRLIAVVRGERPEPAQALETATEWMAESYVRQSEGALREALDAAAMAVERSPGFGMAWVRLAELDFSFGRHRDALESLRTGLRLSPRHAEAHAVRGFLLSARHETMEAEMAFRRALALDGGLANAWLGRGLCLIRQGQVEEGLVALEVAAATEPNRAVLRSYLGKGFAVAGKEALAREELDLARRLDPEDPTPWLYAALLNQQENRINEAIRDLQGAIDRNGNRQVYRSRLLLDQDRAVSGANLATIYSDAGMDDVGFREASRSVNLDYANYAAHFYLANSYQQLRDPNRVGLRYDSAWFTEYLLANLLAPPSAGVLSQTVTQQEYGRLFERNGWGFVGAAEYRSNGDWSQAAAVLGRYEGLAVAVDQAFQTRHGQRPNNDVEQWTYSLQLKQALTPEDSVFFQAFTFDAEGGDLAQVYDPDDPSMINRGYRFEEEQEPVMLAGYHRQWSPGSHTLLLAGRVHDRLRVENPAMGTALVERNSQGQVIDGVPIRMMQDYESRLEAYSAEAQQIWQVPSHTMVAGARYQFGEFTTANALSGTMPPILAPLVPEVDQNVRSDYHRWSGYGYYQWRLWDPLLFMGGISYDRMRYPENHRLGPVSGEEDSEGQWSPKAGLTWTPSAQTTIRLGYARSMGGVSLEDSLSLEPAQVAGFTRSYRSIIPESVAGSVSAADQEILGIEWAQEFGLGTYLGLRGEYLSSEVDREVGVYELVNPPAAVGGVTERLDYDEATLRFTLHQLVGDRWVFGGTYAWSEAGLRNRLRGVPAGLAGGLDSGGSVEATLHQGRAYALFHHPCGFFFQADGVWSSQHNRGYEGSRPGDDFWQFNVWAGYRFDRRRAELRVGVLNLTDEDYRLNPLNLTPELPRERTLAVNLRVEF